MATELAKAYVQIIPSAQGIQGKIQETIDPEAGPAGTSFGSKMIGTIKNVIAAAAIGKAIKASISEGANLEQSIGGIETLFKKSADKVKANAANAYKTAGMSANEYMELTTSFSASLLSSLSNNTSKAADVADMAMTDMSDNANKMGSNMEDIKNAYQGFAKQNYTMLDNLKLGYGGTKTEMQRLLKDAQKISGVKYDINNLSDVYSAIHVIQGELDITGTTAKEAATTISGSMNSMKAAAKNVMGQIALGMDVGPALAALGETTITFFAGNLLPAVANVLSGLPDLIAGVTSIIVRSINMAANNMGEIVHGGGKIVLELAASLVENAPYLAEAAIKLIAALAKELINTDWAATGRTIIDKLKGSIDNTAGQILGIEGKDLISYLVNAITSQLPKILNKGVEIVTNLVNGILQKIPSIITMAGTIISNFVNAIYPLFPKILQSGATLLLNLVNGIIKNLPQIVSAAAQVIVKITSTIGQNLPQVLQSGITIIGKLAAGLIRAIPTLVGQIPQIVSSVKNAFIRVDWGSVGINIVRGIANGLRNAGHMMWDAVKGVLGNFKSQVLAFFGIHSPSRWGVFVGEMIDAGFAKGIVGNLPSIDSAVSKLQDAATSPFTNASMEYEMQRNVNADSTEKETVSRLDTLIALLKNIIEGRDDGDITERDIIRALRELGVVFA